MIAALFCDLDGTLIDSERLYLCGNCHAAQQLGLNRTRADFLPLVGASDAVFRQTLDAQVPPSQQAAFVALTQGYVDAALDAGGPSALEGAEAMLAALADAGVALGLVTVSPRAYVARVLANRGWQARFAWVVTGENGAAKPAPDLYQVALAQSGLPPAAVLALEDSPIGVAAAVAAGLRCAQVCDLAPQAPAAVRHFTKLSDVQAAILAE